MKKTRILGGLMALLIATSTTGGFALSNSSKTSNQLTVSAYAQNVKGNWITEKNGKRWYRHVDGSYTKNDWEMINNKWYYFGGDGYMLTGKLRLGTYSMYYLHPTEGYMLTDWRKIDNRWWYYFDNKSGGKALVGWQSIGGSWYYFNDPQRKDPPFAAAVGFRYLQYNGIYNSYYFDRKSCKMKTGWFILGKKKYYAFLDGHLAVGTTYVDGKRYIFNDNILNPYLKY